MPAFLALALALQTSPVVVMRREIARPAPRPAATPAAPAFRWDAGVWTTPKATQCGQTLTRMRVVRYLGTGDAVAADAQCPGSRPADQEVFVDYTTCAVNYSCPTWVDNRQGTGGPHYLVYDGAVDATEDARRTRAQKLCEAQPRDRSIQICTSTVLAIKGQPDRLRIFASRGTAANQPPDAVIDASTTIKTSSIAMCSLRL